VAIDGRSAPFQRTMEKALKPLPLTESVNAAPATILGGDKAAAAGSGLLIGASAANASNTRTRGTVTEPPGLVSAIGKPVCRRALRMMSTLAAGTACLRRAQLPPTRGVAIEVPSSSM